MEKGGVIVIVYRPDMVSSCFKQGSNESSIICYLVNRGVEEESTGNADERRGSITRRNSTSRPE